MRLKVKTALIVIILSCLIWVFAEQASTKSTEVELSLELPNQPENLLVEYLDEKGNLVGEDQRTVRLTVRGPTRRILEVNEAYVKSKVLDVGRVGFLPEGVSSQNTWVPVMTLLDGQLESQDGKYSALPVEQSDPESVHLRLTRLMPQPVPVKVYDQDNTEILPVQLEPKEVTSYVPEGQSITARVILTEPQRRQAIQEEIEVTAQVALPRRVVSYPVKLKLLRGESLKTETIRSPRLMVDKPYSLEGQYRVVLEDPQQLDEYKIECRGREEDLGRYLNSDVHLVLKINESDLNRASLQFTRPLIYYLPGEFGQVEILNKKEVPISFRLEKIESK